MFNIERSTPESCGISSIHINKFINRLYSRKVPMHSLLIMRDNKLVAEKYYNPCNYTTLHRMFSISKSFTSIAILLLVAEGKINLDDSIVKYFPEYDESHDLHPYIYEMTIRNMLMMRTCHEKTTYKFSGDSWVGSFFTTLPSHKPGTVFHYDTSSAHVLCALVEKITGMDMLDYVKIKLADLGFSKESYMLKDPYGVSIGGSGLVATSMDILKFGYFLINKGNVCGKQLIPSEYIDLATSNLTSTNVAMLSRFESCGYGMMFWQTEKAGYVAYGMGGQFVIVNPEYNLVVVTTADTQGIGAGNQEIFDALHEEILPYIDKSSKEDQIEDNSEEYIKSYDFPVYIPSYNNANSDKQSLINETTYKITNNDDYETIALSFDSDVKGSFKFRYKNDDYSITFGIGQQETGHLPLYDFYYCASGTWLPDGSFYIKVNVIDSSVGSIHLQLSFEKDEVVLFMRKIEETMLSEFSGHLIGSLIGGN